MAVNGYTSNHNRRSFIKKTIESYRDLPRFSAECRKYYANAVIRLGAKTANLYLTRRHSSCKKRWLCHEKK
jgi:hypothetical protein